MHTYNYICVQTNDLLEPIVYVDIWKRIHIERLRSFNGRIILSVSIETYTLRRQSVHCSMYMKVRSLCVKILRDVAFLFSQAAVKPVLEAYYASFIHGLKSN